MNLIHCRREARLLRLLRHMERHTVGKHGTDVRAVGSRQKNTGNDDGHGELRQRNGGYDKICTAPPDLLCRKRKR